MEKKWYQYLSPELLPLVEQSLQLLHQAKANPYKFDNYDYVVFPFAKAYEPFLKKYLFDLHLIDEHIYRSKKFSIGRSLNPDVHLEQRDENWYYDDLVKHCGQQVAREIWQTWLKRNQLFHLYPGEIYKLNIVEAEALINQFIKAIELCQHCG